MNSSTAVPMGMPALEMIGYHNILSGKLKLQNNGHSGKLFQVNEFVEDFKILLIMYVCMYVYNGFYLQWH